MGIQQGTQVLAPLSVVTITFLPDSTLNGYDGCNNYNADVYFTGATTPRGSGMGLGPLGKSANGCTNLADQEDMYFQILSSTSAYNIDSTQLTLTGETGDVLIYERPSTVVTTIPPPY
jgi:heat shock protein HslJ